MNQHTIEFRVRYSECDPMGVAHHSAYPIWFEMGRTELLRVAAQTDYRELEAQGVFLAVVSLSVRYRRPARYDDQLRLLTRLEKLGRAKIEHSYELYRASDSILLATAATVLACLDRNGRPQPLPPQISIAL